jgi:hypothetical protein
LDLKGRKTDSGENCIMMNFTACILHGILLGWAGHVAHMREGRGVYRVLVGKPEGKRPLGGPKCRCDNNIKLDLREIRIDGSNWIRLAQDRAQWRVFVNTVMKLRVP